MDAVILNEDNATLIQLRELIKPDTDNGASEYVTGNPYRRVYKDKQGHFVKVKGNRKPVIFVS